MTLKTQEKNWWSLPLMGKTTLWERINQPVGKPAIPHDVLCLYQQSLAQGTLFAEAIRQREQKEFTEAEFLSFLKMRNQVARQTGEYKYLLQNIKLFAIGIQFKDLFLVLGEIENRYQGLNEQHFFSFIDSLLLKNLSKKDFLTQINEQFSDYMSFIHNSQSKNALKSYKKAIEILAENELALHLLSNFKKRQINYVIFLKKIINSINQLTEKKVLDNRVFLDVFVHRNSSFFKQVSHVIELPITNNYSHNITLILQYVALNCKYRKDYLNLREFLDLLNQWQKVHQIIVTIRDKYEQYYCPDFKQEIPGLNLYQKYSDYCRSLIN